MGEERGRAALSEIEQTQHIQATMEAVVGKDDDAAMCWLCEKPYPTALWRSLCVHAWCSSALKAHYFQCKTPEQKENFNKQKSEYEGDFKETTMAFVVEPGDATSKREHAIKKFQQINSAVAHSSFSEEVQETRVGEMKLNRLHFRVHVGTDRLS